MATYRQWIEALQIFAAQSDKGLDAPFYTSAEHDILYTATTSGEITEDSEEGLRLKAIGFHIDSDVDVWVKYT